MAFPLFLISNISLLLGKRSITIIITKFLSKKITDKLISNKIYETINTMKGKIDGFYAKFWRNTILSFGLNLILIGFVTIVHFYFTFNGFVITAVSIINLFIIMRIIVKLPSTIKDTYKHKNMIKTFINYKKDYSLPDSIKMLIGNLFNETYNNNINKVLRMVHSIFSIGGFVKTKEGIKEEVIEIYFYLIKDYVLRTIISKIISITVFYTLFIFLLKPVVYENTIDMSIFSIILFPFTIGIPKIVEFATQLF